MEYVVVYDLVQGGYRDWPVFVIAGAMMLAAIVFWFVQKRKGKKSGTAKVLGVFSVLVALIGLMTVWDYTHLRKAYAEGKCEIVEGVIQNHWKERVKRARKSNEIPDYDTYEGFSVNGRTFSYNQDASQASFHNGGSETLELRDGMPVRLHVYKDRLFHLSEDRILRVEVARG